MTNFKNFSPPFKRTLKDGSSFGVEVWLGDRRVPEMEAGMGYVIPFEDQSKRIVTIVHNYNLKTP